MKNKKTLALIAVFANALTLAACGGNNDKSSSTTSSSSTNSSSVVVSSSQSSSSIVSSSSSTTIDLPMTFEDKTVTYDGNPHSIYVENLPEGSKAMYSGNEKVEPGTYNVSVRIKHANGDIEYLSANLVIEKKESILTADAVQQAYVYGGAQPTYSLNNTEQKVDVKTYYTPGTYQIELFAPESKYYKESNHVSVNFFVREGNYIGVKFDSATFKVDGTEKELLATDIPSGYEVKYVNNKATTQGKYNAVCEVYNSNGDLELTLNAIMTLDNEPNAEFEEYLHEIFLDYLGDDYISWNIFAIDPSSFGFVRDETAKAHWYTYETFEDNYTVEAYEEMTLYYSYLKEFENADLSYNQLISYNVLDEYFQTQLDYYNPENGYHFLMDLVYIDQFGGYASNFGTYIERYNFRDINDINDVLDYIASLPTAFESYLLFADDKAKAGYPISDFTLDGMIGYLNDVIEQEGKYYLATTLKNSIGNCEFLTPDEISNYQDLVDAYFTDYFFPAHRLLAEGLEEFKGLCTETGYLATYGEVGKSYYAHQMQDLLGLNDFDITEFGKEVKSKLSKFTGSINSVVSQARQAEDGTWDKFLELTEGKSLVGELTPDEMIDFLKEFAPTIVPDLQSEPDITIKYMDMASAEVSNALAYYMKSPLDSTSSEYITLNGAKLGDTMDVLSTMAHEGYPGHLYAYCFSKELDISNVAKIMTSTAHAEGWAKYIELQLWQYLKTHHILGEEYQKAVEYYCDYMYYNDLAGYLLYTYIDYAIHIEGWSVSQVATYMNRSGFNGDAAEEIYNQLIEMPTQYAAYGYGIMYFHGIHETAKSKLGSAYNEIEFNAAILSKGWCSLGEVQNIVDEYIADKQFTLNLK